MTWNSAGSARRRVATISLALLSITAFAAANAQNLAEQAQLCDACHGTDGIPQDSNTPVIWGQHAGYLYLQLRDFKRGTRKNEIMSPFAEALERDEMLALAEFYEKRPWPRLGQPSAPADIAATALRANTEIGCTGCHLGEYQGAGTQPRLAGQRRQYLERSMLQFRDGTRGNNPGMSDLMKVTSTDEIAAMAQYLAGR